jgi:hypothetical protein
MRAPLRAVHRAALAGAAVALVGVASAAPPESPPDSMDDLLVLVSARVEAHADREFDHLPELVMMRTTDAADGLRARIRRDLERRGPPEEVARDPAAIDRVVEAQVAQTLGQGVGLYVHSEDRIYLFEDNIERYVAPVLGPPNLLGPYLACTLAHELTHALQFQSVGPPHPANPLEGLVVRAVREGHANRVGEAVCRELNEPALIGFDRGMQGIDAMASRPRAMAGLGARSDGLLLLLYGYGQRYMDYVARHGGQDAVWAEVNAPSVGVDGLLAAATMDLPRDTRTPIAAAEVSRRLSTRGSEDPGEDLDTIGVLDQLGIPGLAAVAAATGAWQRHFREEHRQAVVYVIRFDAALRPGALLQHGGEWRSDDGLARRSGADVLTRRTRSAINIPDGGPLEEVWATRDDLLIVVQISGGQPSPRQLARALRAGFTP